MLYATEEKEAVGAGEKVMVRRERSAAQRWVTALSSAPPPPTTNQTSFVSSPFLQPKTSGPLAAAIEYKTGEFEAMSGIRTLKTTNPYVSLHLLPSPSGTATSPLPFLNIIYVID